MTTDSPKETPMTEATHTNNCFEQLDYREGGGIHVVLLWNRTTSALSVLVLDTKAQEYFAFPVAAREAMDAFRHPFAYAASRPVFRPDVDLVREGAEPSGR
jgi:hypothetical protein